MYIHKEIISVVVLIILILGFAAIKFLIDFKRLNKDLKNLSRENLSAKDYFFFHQFEPFIYKLNSYSKIFNQQLSAKRLQILFYDKFFNSFPDPLFIIDQNNQIFQLNIMATKLVGKKAKSQNINSVLRIPGLGELIQKSAIKKKPQESTLTLSFPIETVYNVWVSGPSNLGGTKLNFIRLYDYTDEKKVNDLRTEFVSNVSHELKTPIAAIVGYCETLLGVGKKDSQVRVKFLKIIKNESLRISSLVNDLLSLSRIERIEHTPPESHVNLNELLEDVINISIVNGVQKNKIKFSNPRKVIEIIGDYDELKQVFINILDNSLKYGKSKKPIEIRLKNLNHGVKVEIEDFGSGIKKEDIPMLTNRFYRVDSARSRELGSTGLGLSIVKHILNRHKTELEITSELNKGSKFSVNFKH